MVVLALLTGTFMFLLPCLLLLAFCFGVQSVSQSVTQSVSQYVLSFCWGWSRVLASSE